MAESVTWQGASGKAYTYNVYGLDTKWYDKAGNYILAGSTGVSWQAIYVGETESFSERLPNHERLADAKRLGATHIHAHTTMGGVSVRRSEETDLIRAHNPPCNDTGR